MDGTVLAAGNLDGDLEAQRKDYTRALISEIRLLVRTVSNDPFKHVTNLKLTYKLPGEPSLRELAAPEIIDAVSKAEAQIDLQSGIDEIGFLQLVRDTLVSMTAPATGLTIAYTTLVAGEQRSQSAELSGCETSLAASAIRRALVVSQRPERMCGPGLASSGLALRCSAVTWFGVLPSSARWRRAL
jgi:hypothetical protein